MQKIKDRWEISSNWQLLFPFLGAFLTFLAAYMIARRVLHALGLNNTAAEWIFTGTVSISIFYVLVKFFVWCFKKLENKWVVEQKWEMISIFIVFAITGSLAGKLAGPLVHWIGLDDENVPKALYWTCRILMIFPIYQLLLVCVGWLFGQFKFFWAFEKKMLKRMGLGFLLP